MTKYGYAIAKLMRAIVNRAGDNFGAIRVDCWEERVRFNDVKKARQYMNEVDDVRGVTVFDKDGDVLGVFGIEPMNYDGGILDMVYDYTDCDFCNDVMKSLE